MAKSISKVLVTGGAGFIGSHTVDALVKKGYDVTVLDLLDIQVHGSRRKVPAYLSKKATFVRVDLRDRKRLGSLLRDEDAVIHLASAVGVGQSMYEIERYVDANTRATAMLLDFLVNKEHSVKKLVVASSMSIYGEGKYHCEKCSESRYPDLRDLSEKARLSWEHKCPECNSVLRPVPTDEASPLRPTSIYAQTKRHQEEMSLLIGKTYGLPTVALRYFNVYGPRQSMSNPYTGAAAIFLSRILNGKRPYVFEDGRQQRDFIFVEDLARANVVAMEKHAGYYDAFNIGTGVPTSILSLSQSLCKLCGGKMRPEVTGNYRKGDIRDCFAATEKATRVLGYKTNVSMNAGLLGLISWAKANKAGAIDRFDKALGELRDRLLAGAR